MGEVRKDRGSATAHDRLLMLLAERWGRPATVHPRYLGSTADGAQAMSEGRKWGRE
jgi:hypothetical protein